MLRHTAPTLALLVAMALGPAPAQNLFAPVARVGDRVVTSYELDQRVAFNRALNAPGDLEAVSLDQLIDDRLRAIGAELNGIDPSEEEVAEGMAEFASRADLSLEEFVAEIGGDGVAEETFREFVRAGLAFRLTVQERFGSQVDVATADVDRARALVEPPGGLEVSLSEIILPADTPEAEAEALAVAERLKGITSFEGFVEAARQVSFAATRDIGGRLDPLALEQLPGPLREQLLRLSPGEVTDPVALPGAIVVFQLRALRETGARAEPAEAIDYAAFYIPGGRSPEALRQAAALRASADTCDDLYGAAEGLPPERLERGTRPVDAIPADVAAQLALLDPDEASTALTRAGGRTLVFLMLCERDPPPDGEAAAEAADPEADPAAPSDEALRVQVRNQRLQAYADAYLDELRAAVGVEVLVER